MMLGQRSRAPLPEEIVVALFCSCLDGALEHPERALHMISAAVLFRVAFYGLLRPIEMLSLRFGDLRFHSDAAAKSVKAIIAIRNPKSRRSMGLAQFVVRSTGARHREVA